MTELKCWNCGAGLQDIPTPISRHANCPDCFNELHCCRLCVHYQPSIAAGQCNEERADPPVIKEGANFCDWFRPNPAAYNPAVTSKADDAQGKLDALFGNAVDTPVGSDADASDTDATENIPTVPLTPEDEARAALDRLFSDPNPDPDGAADAAKNREKP